MSANTNFIRSGLAAASVVALIGITPAFAADVINDVPAPAVPMDTPPLATWTGAYAGIQAGYGFSGRANDNLIGRDVKTDGFVGGGFAGYNYDTGGGVVAGVEGDLGYNGVEGQRRGVRVRGGLEGSLRARLGYTVTPEALAYVTAGGAGKNTSVTEGGVKDSQTQLGWTAGAGIDVKLTQNVFGRAEYRYSDYGSDTFNTGSGAHQVDSRDHRIQFGVGMQF
ncbi:MAG: porin family protein [Rhizobiaceae bacterium]|nr:porin family protein [Rhizobiaceae bacterium]